MYIRRTVWYDEYMNAHRFDIPFDYDTDDRTTINRFFDAAHDAALSPTDVTVTASRDCAHATIHATFPSDDAYLDYAHFHDFDADLVLDRCDH